MLVMLIYFFYCWFLEMIVLFHLCFEAFLSFPGGKDNGISLVCPTAGVYSMLFQILQY